MAQVKNYIVRERAVEAEEKLVGQGMDALLARLYAARGVVDVQEMAPQLEHLLRPDGLKGIGDAGRLLADAIQQGQIICVVADYDCDGAAACAVTIRGLRILGAAKERVSYVVPDRKVHGYGLTPTIVDLALQEVSPQVLVTVDNGIASFAGVAYGRKQGMKVIVTDHHLPAKVDGVVSVPDADAIVNPSQPGCGFASKNACGAAVAFYTLLEVRAELRRRGVFEAATQPRLDVLLDLVGLATVADVVKLDANNRRFVAQGLKRIREGKSQAGIGALFAVAGRKFEEASAMDLGFTIGPRINAAGRLADMTIGIECLLTDDVEQAGELAKSLHAINVARREVESGMNEQAAELLDELAVAGERSALVVHDETFHEGVIGIVAGKIKDKYYRPTFVFADAHEGTVKGSGRSIPGFHMRDALDLVSKRKPDLILKFGGHSMAAGCTLKAGGVEEFRVEFEAVAAEWLTKELLERRVATDGSLQVEDCCVEVARLIESHVWGQAFEAPLFMDMAQVVSQKIVGEKHLKLTVIVHGKRLDAIWFGRTDPAAGTMKLAYRIGVNSWNGRDSVQLVVDGEVMEQAA